jgi:N4-gp56 family major capsid protein
MAITQMSSLNSAGNAAFEQLAYFALRSQPLFEMVCDVKTTNQSHAGASVKFTTYADAEKIDSAISETSDIAPVTMSDAHTTVTLAEYGNSMQTTAKARGTSFLNIDADAANIIGYNMADSLDHIVHDVITEGTNVLYGGDATNTGELAAGDIITANLIRKTVANLRTASAPAFNGNVYVGFIHPDVSYDLRKGTDVTDVIQHQIRQDGNAVRTGSIGTFGGVDFIETPRVELTADAGASNVDEYKTIICGKQALAKAHSAAAGFGADPSVVFGPVTDSLRRFNTVGWYHLVGYGVFRQASLRRIETSSSIGAN